MLSFKIQLFVAILFTTLISNALGHSYLTKPISRTDQTQSNAGCRGPACLGPCDTPLADATRTPILISRGAEISAQWPRNNHAGGFIRFSWAPTSQSDTMSVFDNNVQQINCHEVGGCYPDDPTNPNGGDSGPADGSSRACTSNFTVPLALTDGLWTLQWAWFGGAFALGDYFSCVDYQISGGPTGSSVSPIYVGGDYTYPGQAKCKFFNTNAIHKCVDEPCSNPGPIYTASAEEAGAPISLNAVEGGASSSVATPLTTGQVVTPITSGRIATPITSGRVVTPITSGHAATPITSGHSAASTTSKHSITSGQAGNSPSPVSLTTGIASSTCVGGSTKCANSTSYETCLNGVWTTPQSCGSGLECQQSASNGAIYCTLPGQIIRDVNNANKLNFSLWIALAFLIICFTL